MKGSVEVIGELKQITNAAYILGKADEGLKQLASGLPGPKESVQGCDVWEKLFDHLDGED